ncbi:ATP-binding protein [Sporosarcina sp. Marseille-Q4943]|uniref:ATP-binding protein n=1 Tax=Sporosarcina sp. Marseille-Q4943 TaxID=2942204 RepID=UPI00208DA9A0|nr:AAA family ATPase [Sporosarcina sp. Marseille-Q4943]
MKEIKLVNLKLRNFKGIKNFDLKADGNDLDVYGDNGTGKTTLMDAFLWVLFSKDSNNRADFAIKTLEAGKEINNLEHEVEATFSIGGHSTELRKVYKEKWTKKRGAPLAEFTGHETKHYIDGVPVQKKEYEEKVGSIVKEEVFKLLTNPLFFNESLKWQDRRKTLLEVCGDVEFEDVLAFNSDLRDLPAILKGRAIEDHRKVIASRRAEINKELDRIPVRISEVENSMPETAVDAKLLVNGVAEIEEKMDENATLINNIRNGAVIVDRQQKLKQTEMDLESIKRNLESESVEEGFRVQTKIQEEQSNLAIIQRRKDDAEFQLKIKEKDIVGFDEKLVKLREQWANEDQKHFEHNQECECPTCGQALPAEELEAAKEKALSAFNLAKATKLENISNTGKSIAEDKAKTLENIEELKVKVSSFQSDIEAKENVIAGLTDKLNALREAVKDARQDSKYLAKLQEQELIKTEIKKLQENAQEAVADIEQQNAELRSKRSELNAQIAQQVHAETSQKRIVELEEQQKELATEFEQLERELFLTEEFIRSKVELLEERINSKFKFARFKLFDTQINGGLQEVCETTFEGVPYSSGLNNAARINVGIDIINTLTEHFGIRAPIFVDNAEAVTRLIDTDSQLISLVVSEPDKQLRIESQTDKESDVA